MSYGHFRKLYKGYKHNKIERVEKRRRFCKKVAHIYNPSAAVIFMVVYWVIGLKNAQYY